MAGCTKNEMMQEKCLWHFLQLFCLNIDLKNNM